MRYELYIDYKLVCAGPELELLIKGAFRAGMKGKTASIVSIETGEVLFLFKDGDIEWVSRDIVYTWADGKK